MKEGKISESDLQCLVQMIFIIFLLFVETLSQQVKTAFAMKYPEGTLVTIAASEW
jgi:hypothetical protein